MSDKNEKTEVKAKEPEVMVFVWNTPIQTRGVLVVAATDRATMGGIVQDKPGERITVRHGIYETSDQRIIKFLTREEDNRYYNQDGPDGYRLITDEEADLIGKMRKSGKVKQSELVMRLRDGMKAMSLY